jgi:hypothetical protein
MKKLLLVLLFPVLISAQDTRGRITGRVTDSSGAVVPGVTVRATNPETNVAVSATTNAQGAYDLPYLLPGVYTLAAEFAGFKKYERGGIAVRVDDQITVDITLQPGSVAETVTVTAETPILEEGTSLGQVVDSKRITELPLSGGNAFTLTVLTAGVLNYAVPNHPSLAPAVEVVSNFSVSGARSNNTEFTIDGGSSMWGRNASFVPPADMIGEFKVETARFDAATRSPGGSVNVAIRSGTNKLRGTLYERHNNNKLMGIDFFQRRFIYDPSSGPVTEEKKKSVQPQHVINHFSATLGGPVELPKLYNGKNRTFWIYGFEGLTRPSQERGDYYRTVPTLKERQGDFSDLLAISSRYQIYDPATIAVAPNNRFSRQPFAGNIVPRQRLDPMALGFLKYWPEPNLPGTADGINNYWGILSSYNGYFSHMARVDHNIGSRHRLFGRYNQMHQLFDASQTLPTKATGSHRHRWSKGFGLDDVFIVNPTTLLNVRYSLSRFIQTTTPYGYGFDLAGAGFSPKFVAMLDPMVITFPRITTDNYEQLGNTWPNGTYTNYHAWALDLTKTRGTHSLRFGGEFRLYRAHNYDFTQGTPAINFSTTWTRGPMDNSTAAPIGQDLASFLLGLPTGGNIQARDSYAEQSLCTGLFIQDDYRLTPRLTVNLGLRYEFETAPTERFDRSIRGFDFKTPNPVEAQARVNYALSPIPQVPVDQFRAIGGLLFAGVNGQPRSLWETDHKNVGPRLGLAWRGPRATVLRAGYGIFYITAGVDRLNVNQRGFTQQTTLVPSPDSGLTFPARLSNPFPNGFEQPKGAAGGMMTDAGRAVDFFNPRRPHGYIQRWSFNLQKQLAQRVLFETAYVGSRGTRLDATRQYDPVPRQYQSTSPVRDQPVIDLLTAQVNNPFYPMLIGSDIGSQRVARSQLLRPYPHFNGITAADQVGYSWYHSLQVRTERRWRAGLTAQANYTWAKFMEATSFLNGTDPMPEQVISDLDRPQRLVLNGIYELPVGRGKKFGAGWRGLPAALGAGWQLTALYQANSGQALGFGNILLYGNLHDIPLPIDQRSVDRWFNTDAGFEKDTAQQLNNNIRTFPSRLTGLRGKGINIWNWSAMKYFRVTERTKLQFRCEWLNALNHSHFGAPNMTPTNRALGMITATSGYPRQIYFALKLLF